jgi:hypothetical protein
VEVPAPVTAGQALDAREQPAEQVRVGRRAQAPRVAAAAAALGRPGWVVVRGNALVAAGWAERQGAAERRAPPVRVVRGAALREPEEAAGAVGAAIGNVVEARV